METDKTIAEHTNTEEIRHFVVRPQSKDVEVHYAGSDGNRATPNVDITDDIWPNQLTAAEKTAIKKFFKLVAAAALGVAEGEVTGDFA